MENHRVEYKAEIPRKYNQLKAEIVSFLNSEGGTIYLGVDDNGDILEGKGKADYKEWEAILSNWIANAFSPNVSDLITVFPEKKPFEIVVRKRTEKPYFFKDGEGFNAKGVYVRVGSSKRVASYDEIQRMMFSSMTHGFEKMPCGRNDLTFK